MFSSITRMTRPNIPILYVDAHINQSNTANLLKKLRRTKFNYSKGLAVVCSVNNSMPVQVDKIFQEVKRIKQEHNIKVYGFLADQCGPESYYMASVGDQVYALNQSLVTLKRRDDRLNWNGFLENIGLKKIVLKSSQHLTGAKLDNYTSANTQHFTNRKDSRISERIYTQSIKSRLQNLKHTNQPLYNELVQKIPSSIPGPILGKQAQSLGLVDNIGEHYEILRQKHPECHFQVIKYLEQPKSVKKALAILTSPILLALFIFKVVLKWSLILWVWIKSKDQKNNPTKTDSPQKQ